MKKLVLLGAATFLHATFLAPCARAQEPTDGSFVPQGKIWKKSEVLRTSVNVEQIRFSADGRSAVLAGHGGVSVWDWTKERETLYFSFPKATKLSALALSPDGKRLASGHADSQRVAVWDLSEGKLLVQLNHGAPVRALAFSADGKHLACGGGHAPEEKVDRDYHVLVWSFADYKPGKPFLALERPVRTIAVGGDSVVAEDDKGEVRVWNRASGDKERSFSTHSFVTPLGMIGDGRKIVGYEVGAGRYLSQWDSALEKKERLIDMSPTNQPPKSGFWSNADGSRAATAHVGEVYVWDLKDKRRLAVLTIPRDSDVLALAFTPDSSEVVVAFSNKTVARLRAVE